MIKSVFFENFRNLSGMFSFNSDVINVIFGKNNSGKSNLLDGIKLAFSVINSDNYFKISKSDFKDSDDSMPIIIKVDLENHSIPTFDYFENENTERCGFKVVIKKMQNGKYVRDVFLYNGNNIDHDLLRNEDKIPNIYSVPLLRIEDIYTDDLSAKIEKFIDSEEKYKEIKEASKQAVKDEMSGKITKFQEFCEKFDQSFDIEISDPKFKNEKVFIVDKSGECKEHNYKIGSGYKSIANIILNTLSEQYNIILIDEIENHLHPNLIRTLIRELRSIENTIIIGTTHSPVVINELKMDELIDISGMRVDNLDERNVTKLNVFLHPGRNELMLCDNLILVEGFTEELLLNSYLMKNNKNWTIVNVGGVMFEPYIELACLLNKKIVVISDTDISLSRTLEKSSRFVNLESLCCSKHIKLIEMYNTLETDLYNNGFLEGLNDLIVEHHDHSEIFVAKSGKKTEIALKLIENNIALDNWHVIQEIDNEFQCD